MSVPRRATFGTLAYANRFLAGRACLVMNADLFAGHAWPATVPAFERRLPPVPPAPPPPLALVWTAAATTVMVTTRCAAASWRCPL